MEDIKSITICIILYLSFDHSKKDSGEYVHKILVISKSIQKIIVFKRFLL